MAQGFLVLVQGTYILWRGIYSNMYNVKTEKLIWSIKSEAYNPKDVATWFDGYSTLINKRLKKEGLIK